MLSGLMVTISLSIVYPLLFQAWPALSSMRAAVVIEPFQFLMTPLMGLYVRLLLVPDYRPRPIQVLHLLPFALIGAFSFTRIPDGFQGQAHSLAPTATEILWALLVIQAFLHVLPATRLLFRYRHSLRDEESNLAGIDLGWPWWFVHSFLTLTTVYAVLLVVVLHGPRELPVRDYLSAALTVVVFVVGQRALMQRTPPVIEGLEKRAPAAASAAPRIVVTPEEAGEIKSRLVRAMEVDRLYLEPELSLSDLVTRIGATRNVVRRMNEKSAEDLKITAIAFDAGFNSKPAFNQVFKKHTGLTPSEYRERNRRARKVSAAS